MYFIEGDATNEEVLIKAGVKTFIFPSENNDDFKKFMDENNDNEEDGRRVIISIGDDPIVTISNKFLPSFNEAIDEINGRLDNYENINQGATLQDVFRKLVLKIQVWSNNNYNTHLLHYKIAFPLLKKLKEIGETKFQIIFQQEILRRYATGTSQVKMFLENEGYLKLIGDFF